jgi:hypothetical protein
VCGYPTCKKIVLGTQRVGECFDPETSDGCVVSQVGPSRFGALGYAIVILCIPMSCSRRVGSRVSTNIFWRAERGVSSG